MGETTYIFIDDKEKRVYIGHNQNLDGIMAALSKDPANISQLDSYYESITSVNLFDEGTYPSVPEEVSIDTLRLVLGMTREVYDRFSEPKREFWSDEEVLDYWKKVSLHDKINYRTYSPDEKTSYDIPEITDEMIKDWNNENEDREEPETIEKYRASRCGDGIVVADLRKKEIRWVATAFTSVPRERPDASDKNWKRKFGHNYVDYEYSLPSNWKLVAE